MSQVVSYERTENIALIIVDNPPVNALSVAVRQGLWDAFDRFAADVEARAAILLCAGNTFIAGADIREFNQPPREPLLPSLIAGIEQMTRPVVAALHGTALGGGFETALGCHYRCASASARVGFPEVNLGLLPGAGGTQRLPRLAGITTALEMILTGKPITASRAFESGIIDEILEGDLQEAAVRFTRQLLEQDAGTRRVSEMSLDASAVSADFFSAYETRLNQESRGYLAPFHILKCIRASMDMPFAQGIKLEHHGNVTFRGRQFVDALVADQDFAITFLFQAGDHPQGRRLATTRRAEKTQDLAFSDGHIDAVDGCQFAEALGQIFDSNVTHCSDTSVLDSAEGNAAQQMVLQHIGDNKNGDKKQADNCRQQTPVDAE